MALSLIFPVLLLIAVSVVIIGYFIRLLSSAFGGNPFGWMEVYRLQKKERLAKLGDDLYKSNDPVMACKNWRAAFFLGNIRHKFSLIDSVSNHNLGLLARLVNLKEKKSVHLPNLAIVEGLIISRAELLRSCAEVNETLGKLKKKRATKGSSNAPDWAFNEFSKKLGEIKEKLDGNYRALNVELDRLFATLNSSSASNEITYH